MAPSAIENAVIPSCTVPMKRTGLSMIRSAILARRLPPVASASRRERRAVSPRMALRLSRLFGNSPEFWLNAQRSVDLWDAGQAIKADVARIKPLRVA